MASTKLTAPNGGAVSVDSSRVDNLLRYGFTKPAEKKSTAKKSADSKSE
jgi:hypothetical protein